MKLRHGKGRLSHGVRSASKRNITNRFELVRCEACGRRVKRKSRQQLYCSDRCREWSKGQRRVRKSFLDRDTRASPHPLFLSSKVNGLQREESRSSIPLNVLGGYRWPNAVDVDRGLLGKIVRAEIRAWVCEKAVGIGSAPDQADEPSAPPGVAVRDSAKSLPDAHSGTRRRPR
jgi:endogenous inhibitor of DNA gyrase (YacG/DUF329 family)